MIKLSTNTQEIIANTILKNGGNIEQIDKTEIYTLIQSGAKSIFLENYFEPIKYNHGLIMNNKNYIRSILKENKIPYAQGKAFHFYEENEAKLYAKHIKFPVILRLVNSTIPAHSEIVFKHIDFKQSFQKIAEHKENILLEKYIHYTHELRIFVTSDEYLNVIEFVPSTIIGDGKSSIAQLVVVENFNRLGKNNFLKSMKLSIKTLEKQGYTQNSIAPQGKKIILNDTRRLNLGAFCNDITKQIYKPVKKIAQRIISSFPKIKYIGFKLLCNSYEICAEKNNFIINEVYLTPGPNIVYSLMKDKKILSAEKAITNLLFKT